MTPQLFDSAETIKWLRLRRIEMKRELRRLRKAGWAGMTSEQTDGRLARMRYLKRAIHTATEKLDVLQGKKKA